MKLNQKMVDIVEQNEPLFAAKAITAAIKDLPPEKVEAALYFALIQAERKGQEDIAKIFATKADTILTNIEALNQLSAI